MVSTYFSYSYITRNLKQSLARVEQQTDVAREEAYYKANIGKVKTVDDFMKDYRLYHYAMKAYGLEDMAYAKAFMKKVLESDLSDPKSFVNKLVDKRYQEFAAAFSFNGGATPVAQSENQIDEMIDLYTATKKSQVDALADDLKYYGAEIGNISSADQLLNNDRLRNYVYSAYGIDESKWPRDTISQVLRSDPSDPNSYVNTTFASQLTGLNAQLAQAKSDASAADLKITAYKAQLSQPGADVNQLNIQILVEKSHLELYEKHFQPRRPDIDDWRVCRLGRRVRVFVRRVASVRCIRPDCCKCRDHENAVRRQQGRRLFGSKPPITKLCSQAIQNGHPQDQFSPGVRINTSRV